MNIIKYLFVSLCALMGSLSFAEESPLWLRYPSISPDGKTIAFCYRGDIFLVPTEGGKATQLTTHAAYDYNPIWSPDSQTIAFGSTRDGAMDVFTIPVTGGTPKRLTSFTGSSIPNTFTPDGKNILYSSAVTPDKDYGQFPQGTQVYSVPVEGGRPSQFLTFAANNIRFNKAGDKFLYHNHKGYEDEWRKHHTSSITRDVWVHDMKTGEFKNLTNKQVEDRYPTFAADDTTIYFLSERFGSFNVCEMRLDNPAAIKPLTQFTKHPVRFLTRSNDDLLCFFFDGEIYTMKPGEEPKKLAVSIIADNTEPALTKHKWSGDASEIALSPNGKEFAFIVRGDIFVASSEHGITKRITNTAAMERDVEFSPDGRSLVYASHRDGQWNVYISSLANEYDQSFCYADDLKLEQITTGDSSCFQPSFSPTGKEIAYLMDRTQIMAMNIETKESRVVLPYTYNYSYMDGDQSYEWSPDGKWILAKFFEEGGWQHSDLGLIKADGSQEYYNLTKSGYSDENPRWMMGGKAIIWSNDSQGMRSHGSWGSQNDIYALFLDNESFEEFKMSKEERAFAKAQKDKEAAEKAKKDADASKKTAADAKLAAEDAAKKAEEAQANAQNLNTEEAKAAAEEAQKAADEAKKKAEETQKAADEADKKAKEPQKAAGDKKPEAKGADKKDELPELKMVLKDFDERTVRLTINSSDLGDAVLTNDGKKLFYLAAFEKGGDLWVRDFENNNTKLLAKLGTKGSLVLSKDGKTLYLLAGSKISIINQDNGQLKGLGYQAEFELKHAEEREAIFNYVWKQVDDKFYDVDFENVDWPYYKQAYKRFLPHINNEFDFAELTSEMLGELNASHTGARFAWPIKRAATASLGAFYDTTYDGDGLKIAEIMERGPLYYLESIKPGMIIQSIDQEPIKKGEDYFPILEGKAGKRVLLSIFDPESNKTFTEYAKAIPHSAQQGLLYERWMKQRADMVDKLSDKQLGYIHISGMNSPSFRKTYAKLLGEYRNRKAIVIDTRFNGGGWLHEDLVILLSGKRFAEFIPRGQYIGIDPFAQWTKPSIVLACEGNYSNAHGFPWVYKELKIGKLVGAPVPGTMTAVWWNKMMNGVTFGIPQVGMKDNQGRVLENLQLEPDIEVYNTPEEAMKNIDKQLEAAVQSVMQEI